MPAAFDLDFRDREGHGFSRAVELPSEFGLQPLRFSVTITKDRRTNRRSLKFHNPQPISPSMVNPISTLHTSQANEAKPAAPKPQQTQPKSAPQPSDTVTLKSTPKAGSSGDGH